MGDYTNEELVFGLDIGTRTVIGIVGYKENNQFVILGFECVEHEERAMLDGQIHDITKVAKAVCEVKASLEKKLNIQLTDVAIAAAGRALSTQMVCVDKAYDELQEFALTDVHNLELQGVEKAKEEQQKMHSGIEYFCVAYSVISYYLDGYIISNLEGHKGSSIGAKIIATFLPKQVIDSLYAVTERAGLSVAHLTLEPIAAINAIIPENLRLLNLGLVDIGAGTSDIAITKDGSVTAYGMIPIAGDEVTEVLVHHFLVDFNTAERIKQQLTISETVSFDDILGINHETTRDEVRKIIAPTIKKLTESVAEKILELNGENAPNAVFCVGGGSQMLSVTETLAELLRLPKERVSVRVAKNVTQVIDQIGLINGPEMITPLGICITSMQNKYSQFTTIRLNGQQVKLLNAKKLTVLDAVIAAGIEHYEIFPAKGKTLMFKLNGERMRIKGGNSTPARIMLNETEATLNDRINDGDRLQIEKGIQGKDGTAMLSEYVKETCEISLDGKRMTLPITLVNGDYVPLDYQIKEGNDVQIIFPNHLGQLFEILKMDSAHLNVMVNYNLTASDYKIQDKDCILTSSVQNGEEKEQTKVMLQQDELEVAIDFKNEEKYQETKEAGAEERKIYITVNNEVIALPQKEMPYMLASIFDYIAFDLSKPQGTIQLVKNGLPAALTDNLYDKDNLEIYWKK